MGRQYLSILVVACLALPGAAVGQADPPVLPGTNWTVQRLQPVGLAAPAGDHRAPGLEPAVELPAGGSTAFALCREENFDREPPNWEGVNNRNNHFAPQTVTQDFGYSPSTRHAGDQPGEVGGTIHPAGEPAYYAYRLPHPFTLDDPLSASGKMFVSRGSGHFLLGCFHADTLNEWRTRNTMAARINGRGDGFHCHLEYCTNQWRCEAGVIGTIVRGARIEAVEIPSGQVYSWRFSYDPKGAAGSGLVTFTLDGRTATCSVLKEHRADGATFTHFGLLPVLKSWDTPGEVWIDDVTIAGQRFDFSDDPGWESRGQPTHV